MTIRVLIADDHPLVRDGLRLTIERSGRPIVIVDEAVDGAEVLEIAERAEVDVFLLDVSMPRLNGIEVTRELIRRGPDRRIIVLSLHGTRAIVQEAVAAGARGYLTKEAASDHVIEALCAVHDGRSFYCPSVARLAAAAHVDGGPHAASARLTPRERRVLQLIAEGHGNKQIAALLGITANTVHTHRKNLMSKLGIHKQTDLVRHALRTGIADL